MPDDKTDRVNDYARRGAEARLAELLAEIEFIYERFPQLRRVMPVPAGAGRPAAPKRTRRKPKWTPAMKKAAADRMKKYWAGRRAGTRKS